MTERSIFLAALDIANPTQRSAYLGQACGHDAALRQHIEELIAAEAKLGGFLNRPHAAVELTDDLHSVIERPGSQIGHYKLLEQIGEGGFGVVFMAEQQQPVRRKVALKVLKAGMDTRQVIARFEAERQALALMDHPNIARVLDAGETTTGRPYFVMELVRGIPITQFCDEAQLTTRERLELFVTVCQAAQHAHQKGIIHRDIKPTNVLVTLHDGAPVVKVIDFGVAKATGQQLTEKTLFTGFAQMVGTPLYMSPEQAALSGLDIDTRSDIYSLGVLLYELLTSTTPLHKERLKEAAFDEIRRIIREEEPVKPSTRISTLGATATSISALRKTEPHKLSQLLRNELDWIVMKALEKDRTRRYETAGAFAADVGRYLRDEQVEACPPSALYRFRKFARRNRVAFASGALVAAAVLIGLAVSTSLAIVASRQRDRAELATRETQAARRAEATERETAIRERDAARQAEASATHERNNALAAREELRETIYATDMAQVQAAGDSRQFARVAQLLDLQRPAAGQTDLRGFEWHYWKRRLQRGWLRSVEIPQLASMRVGLNTRVFSRNGARLAAITDQPVDSPSQTEFGGLVTVFDGLTGRELVAPFDPFPPDQRQPEGGRRRFMTMSDDGTRLAAAVGRYLGQSDAAGQVGQLSIRDGDTGAEIRSIEIPLSVFEIALTADGSRVAVEYGEFTQPEDPRLLPTSGLAGVKIWDTSTGELVQSLPALRWSSGYGRILWSPDGKRLLRQSVTREIIDGKETFQELFQVVDVESGEELWERPFPRHATARNARSWSPDGELVVIFESAEARIAAKSNAQLWDSYTGKTLAILDRESPYSGILKSTIDFSPNSQRLALATAANEIYVWELPELKLASAATPLHIAAPHLTLQTTGSVIQAISFSAAGRELVSLDAGTSIVTWDATAREETGFGPDSLGGNFFAAISADATKVAFSSGGPQNRMSCVWDLAANREVFRSQIVGTSHYRPGFSADGRRVAQFPIAGRPRPSPENSQIVIHDSQTGEALTTIQLDQPDSSSRVSILSHVFRPDGSQIAALIRISPPAETRGPASLIVWDAATAKQLLSVPVDHASIWTELHYSQDGVNLIVGATDRLAAVVFYDATTGEKRRSIAVPSSERSSFIDSRHQLYGLLLGSDFVVGDLATGQERLRLRGYHDLTDWAVSPDGSRLAVGRREVINAGESEVTLWSLKSGRQLLALNRQGIVETISFSPDGNRLVAAFRQSGPSGFKPIQIWDATPLPQEP